MYGASNYREVQLICDMNANSLLLIISTLLCSANSRGSCSNNREREMEMAVWRSGGGGSFFKKHKLALRDSEERGFVQASKVLRSTSHFIIFYKKKKKEKKIF